MPAAIEIARWLIFILLSIVLVIASVTDIKYRLNLPTGQY